MEHKGKPKAFAWAWLEPQYDGFPAALVRLRAVKVPQLRKLLYEAWRCQAPRSLVAQAGGEGARR